MDVYQLQAEANRLTQAARRLRVQALIAVWRQSAVLENAKEALAHSRQQRAERHYRALKAQLSTVEVSAAGKPARGGAAQ